jgi:HEAT repeats
MLAAYRPSRRIVSFLVSGLVAIGVASAIAVGLGPRSVQADTITLRGGGQVEGKVVPDPKDKDRVQVWLLKGRKPLSMRKAQILEVVSKPTALDSYFVKKKKAPETPQGQYDLGTWCEQNKLVDLAKVHFEGALAIDKSFGPAHKKLGHVYHGGYWVTRDELNTIQGLVKYKGRWVSAEERSQREAEDKLLATKQEWVHRIKMLRQSILSSSSDRRREAESQLMAIREAEAVAALLYVLGNDEEPMRILLSQVLSVIPEEQATLGLVKQILAEPSPTVRPIIFEKLKERDRSTVVRALVRALRSDQIMVINRAAWTLNNLTADEAVPALIRALLTYEQRIVMVPPNNGNAPAIAGTPLVPIGINNGGAAFMTPPAVAPGVVAFGTVSTPAYATPGLMLNAGAQINTQPEPRVVTFTYRNTEVLAALQKLTGRDFDYNIPAWREWMSRNYNPTPKATRKVPQP